MTTNTPLDLSKVSTPRTAAILMKPSWKNEMRELAQQLELELATAHQALSETIRIANEESDKHKAELRAMTERLREAERDRDQYHQNWIRLQDATDEQCLELAIPRVESWRDAAIEQEGK